MSFLANSFPVHLSCSPFLHHVTPNPPLSHYFSLHIPVCSFLLQQFQWQYQSLRRSATTFWRPWHLRISNECLMPQLMLIVTPRSWNGLSIEQNESGLWLWCVWIIEGIIHSPGSRWVITQITHNVVLMLCFQKRFIPKSCCTCFLSDAGLKENPLRF